MAAGKGKGKGKKKKDDDEVKPIPRRVISTMRVVPLTEMWNTVNECISTQKKWPMVRDDKDNSAAFFFRFGDAVHINMASSYDHEGDTLRYKVCCAMNKGRTLLIDMRKSEENLIKLFNLAMDGLFEKLMNMTITEKDEYTPMLKQDVLETLDLKSPDDFTVDKKFKVVLTTQHDNPPQLWIDRMVAIKVISDPRPKDNPVITDTKNPPGLETKKKGRGKKKKK